MMRFTFYLTLLFFFLSGQAQNKLLLCSNYTNDGIYSGVYNNWSIQKGGNYIYIFYESSLPVNDTVFINIKKKYNRKDTNYYEYDNYYLVPDDSKRWAVNKYTFTKSGNYKIWAYDRNKQMLTPPLLTDIYLSESSYTDTYFTDTWYYNQSEIYFYENVLNDSLYNKKDTFTYNPNGTKLIMYIGQTSKQAFKSNHLFVSIYTADKCHEHIGSYTYYIDEKWYWTHIPLYIYQKGRFVVEIHNDDDVFINKAEVEIK
ncbi:MAG: hypothetical protein U0T69_06485 [Chitinophagales bacterium]